ncbi:MAG TPA: hypothetical protein PK344_06610 [Syntrophorhabdaceae bacterium]|nr:hypothetical protein [Syntrophorhabdaceae bacterium]HPA07236.1 hypothetical protein [Methanoregulaceae archaeon]
MYTGHLALGVALKSKFHRVPAIPIIFGSALLDILDGIFIASGIDRVKPNPKSGPYLFTDLTFVDWDHSMLMATIWSLVWGAVFKKNKKDSILAALAVFSHFLIDVPVHNKDLAIYPYSRMRIGWGWWGSLGAFSWILEGVFCAVLLAYAWRETAKRGVSLLWPVVLIAVLFLQLSPWLSPLKFVGGIRKPYIHRLIGALTTIGFLAPCLLLTLLINRAERAPSI